METLQLWLDRASAIVWGGPTVVVLLATGGYLTFVLRGVQLRALPRALRIGLLERDEPGSEGDISHFQALMLALGGNVAVGNLVAVASALALGGPGALLWLWLAGWLVMATRYAEGILGVYYREPDRRGRMAGGPMYYLSRGVGGTFGRVLGGLFAVLAVVAALGMGAAAPGLEAAHALRSGLAVPPLLTAGTLAGLAAVVVAGGVRGIGRTLGVLVPVLVAVYLVTALVVLALSWTRLDDVLVAVVRGAFLPGAAAGGLVGATTREAVRWGMGHGVLSAGTGTGTGGIAAASARTRTARPQALVAMTQTFIDTVVVSAVTGLALLATGVPEVLAAIPAGPGQTGPGSIAVIFPAGLPGDLRGAIVSLGLALFAFATILAWAHYGERSAEYLFGSRATAPFRALFVTAVFVGGAALQPGSPAGLSVVQDLGRVAGGAMVVPNLVGLLFLSGIVVRETTRSPGRR